MTKRDLIAKLETGEFWLWKPSWATWCLVDRRNDIPCAGRINPKTAAELIALNPQWGIKTPTTN